MVRRITRAFVALMVILASVGLFHVLGGSQTAVAGCDINSMRTYANEAEQNGNEARARYLRQEIEACRTSIAAENGDDDSDPSAGNGDADAEPTEEPTTTPTQEPTDSAGQEDEGDPVASPSTDCPVTYLADEPVAEPRWQNSYAADDIALHPDFADKAMADLTTEEALREAEYRRSIDPLLTVADAMAFGLLPELDEDAQQAKFAELAGDCAKWDRLNDEVTRVMRDDYTHEVKTFAPGTYSAMYALSGNDGKYPVIIKDTHVVRQSPFKALVSTRKSDGHIVIRRLECGFQLYNKLPVTAEPVAAASPPSEERQERQERQQRQPASRIPQLPEPSPGMTRDEEGVPEPDEEPTPTQEPTDSATTEPEPSPSEANTEQPEPTEEPTPTDTPTTQEPTPTPTQEPTEEQPELVTVCRDEQLITIPVTERKPGDEVPNEQGNCFKLPAPQPSGVESPAPEDNPVGEPTSPPTAHPEPTGQPSQTTEPQAPDSEPVTPDEEATTPPNQGQPADDPVPTGDFCKLNPDSPPC